MPFLHHPTSNVVATPTHFLVNHLDKLKKLSGVVLDKSLSREGHLLETLGVGGRDISTSDTLGRSIEVIESVLDSERDNLGTDAVGGETGLDRHQAAGLLDGGNDGVKVKRLDGAQVEHLDLDAVLLLERLGGDNRLAHAARHGHDGQVLAGALHLGLADGDHKVVLLRGLGHGEDLAVHELVLENDDGVGVADGSLEKTLGILGGPGRDDLEAGHGAVPRAVILRVLGGDTGGEAVGAAEGDVAGLDTTGHVEGLGGGVDDVVDGLHGEVEGHELALAREGHG